MEELVVSSRPKLRRPFLISAFRGWNDGGQGASLAGGYIAKAWSAQRFAEIEPEGFFDFQATRPHVSLVDGVTRQIDWPDNGFYHAHVPGLDRDAVLLLGIEPNLRWRTFSGLVVQLAEELGVDMVVTLGSLLADVPHTRPSPVSAASSDRRLVEQYGLEPSRYEGPTGIVGVLHDACTRAGMTSLSLWAAVPHYVSLAPSPRAALALCDRLSELLGCEIDTSELAEAAESYAEQVSEAVSADAETQAYVEELERRTELLEDADDLPSGDAIAREFTRYLRERGEQDDDDVARG